MTSVGLGRQRARKWIPHEALVDDLPTHIVKLLEEGCYAARRPLNSASRMKGSPRRGMGHAL